MTKRLFLPLFMALVLALAGTGPVMGAEKHSTLWGDVDNNEMVDVGDVSLAIDVVLGKAASTMRADVDGNNVVDVNDVSTIIDIMLGNQKRPDKTVGGDISLLVTYEAHQAANRKAWTQCPAGHYDQNGTLIPDVVKFVRDHGWNASRLRVFVDPSMAPTDEKGQGAIQDIDSALHLGARIKAAGMQLLLDFHYSDSWADPVKQYTPASWEGQTDEQLCETIYNYTRDCLVKLKEGGACPDYIQVGNEVSYGMLWGGRGSSTSALNANKAVSGGDPAKWQRFANLLNSASRACREVCPYAKVVVHTELLRNQGLLLNFYSEMTNYQVDYDIAGLSYYPYYHGYFPAMEQGIKKLHQTAPDKEIMIVETGYAYKYAIEGNYDYSSVYPITYEGQRAFTADLVTRLNNYDYVTGLYWWFPEANEYGLNWASYRVTDGWYNAGFWDNSTGRALPALDELKNFIPQ